MSSTGSYNKEFNPGSFNKFKEMESEIREVIEELMHQDEKWGSQRENHPAVWLTILTEEVGEVAQEICDSGFEIDKLGDNYEKELIQVAAVALAALKNIKNYKVNKFKN